ncbi:MAG: diphthine--ammonia ligase [Deltaproteobacteria bacterium]|nr:diphthine--ammonia ligase [Deltaproteobacteria bacterium]
MENVLMSWSGGKDSTLALHAILKNKDYRIAALLTTVTEDYDRISMHGVRRVLLERQVAALGFPLEQVLIPKNASNVAYEANMGQALAKYKEQGITSVVFGDIFLEDLKHYREEKLATLGMKGIFPLWKRDTRELAQSLITLGFHAITTCVDTQTLGQQFVGRVINEQFLSDLPPTVDACGENGEYHSFVYDGPIFKEKIACTPGEIVLRDNRFCYCDLLPD